MHEWIATDSYRIAVAREIRGRAPLEAEISRDSEQNDRNQSVILTLFARLPVSSGAIENEIVLKAKVLEAATNEWNRTRA